MKYLRTIAKCSLGLFAFGTIIYYTYKSDSRESQMPPRHNTMMALPEYSARFQQKGTNDLSKEQELEMIVKNSGLP